MMSCRITGQVDCYTIVPWHLKFEYYDEAENCTVQAYLVPFPPTSPPISSRRAE